MRLFPWLMILILLGVALRLGAGWLRKTDLTSDNDGYLAHAEMIVEGKGFSGPFTNQPTAFRPPAFPIALAALQLPGFSGAISVAILNGVCGIAITWLTWKLARQHGLSNGFSLLASAITTFDPLLVRYSILPMTEVTAAAVALGAIVSLKAGEKRLRTDVEAETAKTAGWSHAYALLFFSGVLFAIGALVRPVILISFAFLLAWRLAQCLIQRSKFRQGILIVTVPLVAAGLTIAPWVIRNAIHFGKFIPATTHGGYTLALGNNTDFYGDVIDGRTPFPWPALELDTWQKKMIHQAAAEGVPKGNETAMDEWYYRRAISAIRLYPASFVKACLLRMRRFFALKPEVTESMPGFVVTLTAIWYSVIGIGVIVATLNTCFLGIRTGMGGACCRNYARIDVADLWLLIFSFMLLHAVYWTDTRMRAPVMPFFCIISAFGLASIFCTLCRRFVSTSSN